MLELIKEKLSEYCSIYMYICSFFLQQTTILLLDEGRETVITINNVSCLASFPYLSTN
uniref:Uncharacterized protein n=1 Tax=Rhizophora mucronata TaxID=61149 RepID=A0A2P2QV25_RHIMU